MNGFGDLNFWWSYLFCLIGVLVWFFKTTLSTRDARLQGGIVAAIRGNSWSIVGALVTTLGVCILLYEWQHIAPLVNMMTGMQLAPGPTGWLNPGTGFLGGFFSQSIAFDRITSFLERRAEAAADSGDKP
jgi:hypothetical protein